MRRPVMIVGADVTHPSPDQIDIPSVAAVSILCTEVVNSFNFVNIFSSCAFCSCYCSLQKLLPCHQILTTLMYVCIGLLMLDIFRFPAVILLCPSIVLLPLVFASASWIPFIHSTLSLPLFFLSDGIHLSTCLGHLLSAV